MKWISRVPSSIKNAKNLIKTVANEELKASSDKRYRYLERQVNYASIEQRWLLIESEERKESDLRKIEKNIKEELACKNKKISTLGKKNFESSATAMMEVDKIKLKLKCYQLVNLELIEIEVKNKNKVCKITVEIEENKQAIKEYVNGADRFILATNIIEPTELSHDDILIAYKEQQSSERGFRFLKNPLFFC